MTRKQLPLSEPMRLVLLCVPAHGSGDSVSPHEVAGRLGFSQDSTNQLFIRALKKGLLVRLRPGDYQLAPKRGTA